MVDIKHMSKLSSWVKPKIVQLHATKVEGGSKRVTSPNSTESGGGTISHAGDTMLHSPGTTLTPVLISDVDMGGGGFGPS